MGRAQSAGRAAAARAGNEPEPGPDPDGPENRPVLRKGSKGEWVSVVQRLLMPQ